MEEIKVKFKIDVKDMYHFFMYHTYSKVGGVFSIVSGLLLFAWAVYTKGNVAQGQSFLYILFGLLFIGLNPIQFYLKAYKQVKTVRTFQTPISYIFNQEGITTMQEEESATIKWEDIQKVVTSRRSIFIYVSKVRANIIPKQAIGDNYNELAELIKNNMEPSKVKIR